MASHFRTFGSMTHCNWGDDDDGDDGDDDDDDDDDDDGDDDGGGDGDGDGDGDDDDDDDDDDDGDGDGDDDGDDDDGPTVSGHVVDYVCHLGVVSNNVIMVICFRLLSFSPGQFFFSFILRCSCSRHLYISGNTLTDFCQTL